MYLGPAFRRFRATLLLLAVIAAGCSSSVPENENAAASSIAPSTTADQSGSEQGETDQTEPDPEASTTEPPGLTLDPPERPPPATSDALASVAGRIAFRSDLGVITTTSPSGEDIVTLSDDIPGFHSQPTWSSDGSRVGWSSNGPAGPAVVIAPADGGAVTQIPSPTPAFYLSWSPESSTLAALGPNAQGVELFFADVSTSNIARFGVGEPFFFDWTDDDTLVAAINGSILSEISVASNAATNAELPSALGAFQAPADLGGAQTLIALASGTGGNDLVSITGTVSETLARAPGPITFSPNPVDDSIAVLVNASVTDSQPIFFQDGAPPTLPPNRVSILDPEMEVQTLDIDGALATQWSPDGMTLGVLVAQATGLEWRFIRGTEVLDGDPFLPSQEFFNSYVAFADQYERSSTWWSPDSQAIVFAGSIDGVQGVWVDLVDDGRGAARIADGDIAFWSPAS